MQFNNVAATGQQLVERRVGDETPSIDDHYAIRDLGELAGILGVGSSI